MDEPVKIRHPPHTRRARQYEREKAREQSAGRRRVLWALAGLAVLLLVLTQPQLLFFGTAAVMLGLALRWSLMRLLPDVTPEAGSSRAPRRKPQHAAPGGAPGGGVVFALVVAATVLAGVGLAGWPPPESSRPWFAGPWTGTAFGDVIADVASWPPLRWIVFTLGLLFAGSIRRLLFQREKRTIATGER
jgi:hypothetical protein